MFEKRKRDNLSEAEDFVTAIPFKEKLTDVYVDGNETVQAAYQKLVELCEDWDLTYGQTERKITQKNQEILLDEAALAIIITYFSAVILLIALNSDYSVREQFIRELSTMYSILAILMAGSLPAFAMAAVKFASDVTTKANLTSQLDRNQEHSQNLATKIELLVRENLHLLHEKRPFDVRQVVTEVLAFHRPVQVVEARRAQTQLEEEKLDKIRDELNTSISQIVTPSPKRERS